MINYWGLSVYCGIVTCAQRAAALERTQEALKASGCPLRWTVHSSTEMREVAIANSKAAHWECMEAARASKAIWMLVLEDDTEPVARVDWERLRLLFKRLDCSRLAFVYLGDRKQRVLYRYHLDEAEVFWMGRLDRTAQGLQAFAMRVSVVNRVQFWRQRLPHTSGCIMSALHEGTAAALDDYFFFERETEEPLISVR